MKVYVLDQVVPFFNLYLEHEESRLFNEHLVCVHFFAGTAGRFLVYPQVGK
jgi:hypothetical protein